MNFFNSPKPFELRQKKKRGLITSSTLSEVLGIT